MKDKYIIYKEGTGEIVEKKSRFIASIKAVKTQEDAIAFIDEKKKEYWDARHNCSAYIIGSGSEIMRCSDDGEPAQTAGRPMLDVLINQGIYNVVVVVTRYFGGVLLGTGGLVRAYQGATLAGLDNCVLLKEMIGFQVDITTDYNGYGKIEYILRERNIPIQEVEYLDNVKISLVIPEGEIGFVEAEIADKTSGTAVFSRGDRVEYGLDGDKVIIFEKNA